MAPFAEIVRALFGVWRLVHLDRRAFAFFDLTVEGAFRSFTAALIVAPFVAVLAALRFEGAAGGVSPGRYVLIEVIAYVISWTLYPLIAERLTRAAGCRARYPAYLCVYNWAMVLQNTLVISVALLDALQILPANLLALLGLAALALTAVLLWFIARVALGVPPLTAIGFVVLDILISILVNGTADALM